MKLNEDRQVKLLWLYSQRSSTTLSVYLRANHRSSDCAATSDATASVAAWLLQVLSASIDTPPVLSAGIPILNVELLRDRRVGDRLPNRHQNLRQSLLANLEPCGISAASASCPRWRPHAPCPTRSHRASRTRWMPGAMGYGRGNGRESRRDRAIRMVRPCLDRGMDLGHDCPKNKAHHSEGTMMYSIRIHLRARSYRKNHSRGPVCQD
jgi:hypothetical protein